MDWVQEVSSSKPFNHGFSYILLVQRRMLYSSWRPGLSDAESIIPRSTNQIYFLSACESFCVNFWILFDYCVRNWARDQKKLKHPKKCSGSYLRTLFLNFETPGCLCSRTPEYSLSAVFSHTEDGAGAAMGAPIVLGPWRWKSFLDTVNEPNIILPGSNL